MTNITERGSSSTVGLVSGEGAGSPRLIEEIRVRGFRSVVDARLVPARMCAPRRGAGRQKHVIGLWGRSHKPERAWRRFVGMERDQLPEPLRGAVERAVQLAREGDGR